MPLRRFLVAQRTGGLTVNIERMMPAVFAIVQWCNAKGYKATAGRWSLARRPVALSSLGELL